MTHQAISNTGERILIEKESAQMIARHTCAYKFAGDYIADKIILDIGCGEGYGSRYLSDFAGRVTAIDYDKEIIGYASEKYRKENLQFKVVDVEDLILLNDKFDIVCSFQCIEHISRVNNFLSNIKKLLKDGGIFICSTPNREDASPGRDVPLNKFHVKEYLYAEFKELLEASFSKVEIFGLKRGRKLNLYRRIKKIGIFNFLPENIDPAKRFYKRISCENFRVTKNKLDTALDFIAVCRI